MEHEQQGSQEHLHLHLGNLLIFFFKGKLNQGPSPDIFFPDMRWTGGWRTGIVGGRLGQEVDWGWRTGTGGGLKGSNNVSGRHSRKSELV